MAWVKVVIACSNKSFLWVLCSSPGACGFTPRAHWGAACPISSGGVVVNCVSGDLGMWGMAVAEAIATTAAVHTTRCCAGVRKQVWVLRQHVFAACVLLCKILCRCRSPSASAVGDAPAKRSGCKQILNPEGCCCCPRVFFCLCLPRSGHRTDPGLSGLLLATCVGVLPLCVAVLSARSFCGICSRAFRRKLHSSLWFAYLWRLEHSRRPPTHARFQRFVTFGQVGWVSVVQRMLFYSHS